ncbi:diguanylate cyclase [Salipiger sp. IMCC34102]|uniref:diguanylate cyclase n=1 Tax=Salipiger sp. IMCC34102 TaxID=2510647 RepID=UPI00101E1584|nr:diguanylate cyclase [Salipiger sp. IMCC34102]RYH01929.1 diguanylate cyclase [Salipiger sp. IMCC34102]
MPSRILIIDEVHSRRTILRVKLLTARYDVDAVDSCKEAYDLMDKRRPDLIILASSANTADYEDLCTSVRKKAATRSLPILMLGGPDTSVARFTALDLGAEDVIPDPVPEALMMSRIRSLLRRATVMRDLDLQADTLRFMGFHESRRARFAPACVLLQSDRGDVATTLAATLQAGLGQRVRCVPLFFVADDDPACPAPDLVVLDATQGALDRQQLSARLADLRARERSRGAATLVLLSAESQDLAALAFDLGAYDVIVGQTDQQELGHRARRLLEVKDMHDRLTKQVNRNLAEAGRDTLTGLSNRRTAMAHLERIAERAQDSGMDYAVILADIDHFKSVNDRHGHAAGDQVLRAVAERLVAAARPDDLVARVGGEEFLIALPDTTVEEALEIAGRMRRRIGDSPFAVSGADTKIAVTISMGVTVDRRDALSGCVFDALFEKADAALYRSKSDGRDTVSLADQIAAA